MDSFSDEELEQLGVILPNYSRSLCTKAFELARNNLGGVTKEDFIRDVFAFCDLHKVQVDPTRADEIKATASSIQPISQLFKEPSKAEEITTLVDELIPEDNPIREYNAHEQTDKSPKQFFAAAIFSLIMIMSAAEKKLRGEGLSDIELMQQLDTLSEHIRIMYEQLLYFDSELENIKNRHSKRTAAQKSNAGHTSLHQEFISFYMDNNQKWRKADCARRFYRSLDDQQKRLYTSERHAERQLTEALRKHLKS